MNTPDPPFLDLSFLVPDEAALRASHAEAYGDGVSNGVELWFPAPGVVGISEGEMVVHRRQVVSLRTTGSDYSAPSTDEMPHGFSTGLVVMQGLFDGMAKYDAPYGGIVLLEWLGDPEELRAGENVYGFTDFALSTQWLSAKVLGRIASLYQDAYVAEVNGLLYVSTSEWFNPSRTFLESPESMRRSAEVAQILGAAFDPTNGDPS